MKKKKQTTPSINTLDAALVQNESGFLVVLRNVIWKNLFPKVKFLDMDRDLQFNQNQNSISSFVLKAMGLHTTPLDYQRQIWSKYFRRINKFFTQHCNNIIKKFKNIAESK